MKILITTDWYAPVINGVVTSVLNLTDGLRALGHEVRILTLSENLHSHTEDNVTYIGAVGVGKVYPDARLRTARAMRYFDALVRWRPDIVHSQCEISTFRLAARIADCCDAPLVHTYHTVYEDYTHYFSPSVRVGKAVVSRLSRLLLNHTDAVIVPSEKTRELLLSYGVETPLHVVPTGIDLARFTTPYPQTELAALRAALGFSPEDTVLLYLRRLAQEKHVDTLLSLLSQHELPTLKLLIVGDGPARSALEEEAAQLHLWERVRFAGMVSPEDVPAYYQLADVFISASQSETQGLTYIEAMASGLPLLCRADPCLTPFIRGSINGCLFTDAASFSEELTWLLASAQRRLEIGRAAQRTALARYNTDAFAEHVLAVYRSALRRDLQQPGLAPGWAGSFGGRCV